MTEVEYEAELLELIKKLKDNKISKETFKKEAQDLGKRLDKVTLYYGLKEFVDKELGWAKYWIEEMDYYGIDGVLENCFDYFKFLEKRGQKRK